MTTMDASERARIFELLDGYSRKEHQCFVAELFLSDVKTTYIVCFRPIKDRRDSPDRYACRYFYIGTDEIAKAIELNGLPTSVTEQLDKVLPRLGEKGTAWGEEGTA